MNNENKKGFVGLIAIIISVVIIAAMAIFWMKWAAKDLEKANTGLNQSNNLIPGSNNSEGQSVNKQLDNLRSSVNNIADKKDQEILNEINKK